MRVSLFVDSATLSSAAKIAVKNHQPLEDAATPCWDSFLYQERTERTTHNDAKRCPGKAALLLYCLFVLARVRFEWCVPSD